MTAERVLVAGASGGTGRAVLRVLARTDVTVRAVTRSADTAERLAAGGAEVVVGDLLDPEAAARAVEGVDTVISAVGSSPRRILRGRVTGEPLVDGRGIVNLVDAATAAGVSSVVMESSLGVAGDRSSWMARTFRIAIPRMVAAKAEAEAAIRESGLRYTVLRPGVLTNGSRAREVQVAPAGTGLWGAVSRRAVAELLVAARGTPAARDRTLEVVYNPLQRKSALDVDWAWA